ncbi:hypothetical protein FE251_08270 [Georgenia wutianyii]|uniref:Uncharacterized protein n=1 Tax=Georgenia wutianyii TaxID=2585135 RepID=A0ABX5VMB0_9MICO|nr:hypothetical protein [Georgenia wutianyii]QDB79365.1 hypothetical protein FE251_08270 [Georgenia wutianyii]
MPSALSWLDPAAPSPLTWGVGEGWEAAALRHDGLVGPTPTGAEAAVDLRASPAGRAGLLREALVPGSALARTTALWVHTGRLLALRTELVVPPERRVEGGGVVHRQHLAPGDVALVAGVPTTTPVRTAVDLLCFAAPGTAVPGARALLAHGLPAEAVRRALVQPARRLPGRRALSLLAVALTPPGRHP